MMKRMTCALVWMLALSACGSDGNTPESCEAPQTLCGSSCVDLRDDAMNCGECGAICGDEQVCAASACAPSTVVTSVPADGAVDVALDSEITLTFSQDVVLSNPWYTLTCPISGERLAPDVSVAQSGPVVTLTLNTGFAYEEVCTLMLLGGRVQRAAEGASGPLFSDDIAITFTTREMPPPPYVLFEEDFDDTQDSGAYAGPLPEGWVTIRNHTSTPHRNYINEAWVARFDFDNHQLPNRVAVSTSWLNPAVTSDEWMFTPLIELPENESCTLYWRAFTQDDTDRDGYEVRVSTTASIVEGGLANDPEFSVEEEESSWVSRSVSLDSYRGENVYIAFRNHSYDGFLLIVDDILVECVP